MTAVTYPGVYMQEVSSGVRPIQAASTSTAAFFGAAERGPIGEVTQVFNFTQFQTIYGGYLIGQYLAHAVFQFFNNGGSKCYVGRVANSPETADITINDRAPAPQTALTIAAVSAGSFGNQLQVTVDSATALDPTNTFDLSVFEQVPGADGPTLLESFAGLTMDPAQPMWIDAVVNSHSSQIRATTNLANGNQVNGSLEGVPLPGPGDLLGANQRELRISINGDGFQQLDLTAALAAADVSVVAEIATGLETAIQALLPLRATTDPAAYSGAAVTVTGAGSDQLRIQAGGVAAANSSVEVLDALDLLANAAGPLGLRTGAVAMRGAANMRPPDTAVGGFYLLGDAVIAAPVTAVTLGSDGTTPQDLDYISALNQLDTVRDVSLIAVPGVGSEPVADAGMNYCFNRPLSDCFFIADMAATDSELTDAQAWRDAINVPNSYGSVYFPWLQMLDPNGGAEPIVVPPSGFVAGVYAQTDKRRGVWKSPAGTEAIVAGAVGLASSITDVEQGGLNTHPKSVSVIRKFPGSGTVLWGARTLASDPEYKYTAVRRMVIFLRASIFNGIQWAVFEPNDASLWAQLRLNLNAFMMTLFRQSAFQGSTPKAAFFVKVDSETTTQADIDNGVVNILIGFAPLKPAEFVVVKISQTTGEV